MQSIQLQDKYPVFTIDIAKDTCRYTSSAELIAYFRQCIEQDPNACFIAEFDHLAHTRSIQGEVAPSIQSASNMIFCFGIAMPNPNVLAVRPRSIGVVDMGTHYTISFMEAPMPPANEAMQRWVANLTEPN